MSSSILTFQIQNINQLGQHERQIEIDAETSGELTFYFVSQTHNL